MKNLNTITMKNLIPSLFLLLLFNSASAQYQTNTTEKGNSYFVNPIFAGDYPDPSILRDGSDYYMVHSSFEYYPGLLIWHSKDLINWEPVTHALTKFVGAVWAPDLVKFNGKFYIYFPAFIYSKGYCTNYVVTANSINGPWSDPVDLKINHIDPGHFTDANGKRYLYFNSGGYVPLSDDGLSITGEEKPAYSGWPIPRDWIIECFCLEGPKITKCGDYYYLTVAEGGTGGPATSHMIISARSKSPFGPWENSPYNPIIRTYESSERWWSKGHGTLFEDAKGKWWMVFHGYENGYYNMGRQTLLEPVEWTADGWFKTPAGIKAEIPILSPEGKDIKTRFNISDDFSGASLSPQWQFFKDYDTSRFKLKDNSLIINAKGSKVGESSPLLCIASDHSYNVQVEMQIDQGATGGLVLFYGERDYCGLSADKDNIFTIMRSRQGIAEKNPSGSHVFLRFENLRNTVNLYYSGDGIRWTKLESSLEVSSFNHNVFDGFMSLRIGLSSFGEGKIIFKNFKYQALK